MADLCIHRFRLYIRQDKDSVYRRRIMKYSISWIRGKFLGKPAFILAERKKMREKGKKRENEREINSNKIFHISCVM